MRIETEREQDGRRIAEILDLPGVMAYSATREEVIAKAEALALRVIADRLDLHPTALPGRKEPWPPTTIGIPTRRQPI